MAKNYNKKMTKDIKYMVEEANKSLATLHMQTNASARTTLCSFVDHILLNKGMYHGFNYYVKDEELGGLKLAGRETTLIQFYIL